MGQDQDILGHEDKPAVIDDFDSTAHKQTKSVAICRRKAIFINEKRITKNYTRITLDTQRSDSTKKLTQYCMLLIRKRAITKPILRAQL